MTAKRSALAAVVSMLALVLWSAPVFSQIGTPVPVSFTGGSATLSLDFSEQDYQLILYPAIRNESDTTRSYAFSVSAPNLTRPALRLADHLASISPRAAAKATLRRKESELAARFSESGVPTYARKAAAFQVGSSRSFVFSEFGNVSTQTVNATLVATSSRAEAWVDVNTSAITTAAAQAQIDRFSEHTYPTVTAVFGAPSDVDGDGKVIFLYTALVDQVGGVAGFYSSGSLFSESDGGDGNLADMMYIGVDHEPSFYESLLAHEFQHLINFNQHVLVNNGDSETSPINEAMSHIAEDLVDQHTQGGNPDNVRTYTETPTIYSLLAESAHDSGLRGTAYTFARSMMESFGDDVPTRLTQTGLAGIDNVEDVSDQTFEEVYETYLARMYLAGSGLNTDYDYSYSFFVDPATGRRTLPVPSEQALNPSAVSVTGTTKAFAAASIRLMGDSATTVSIDADASASFRGVLIPLPKDFRHEITYKADYFAGFSFDNPIGGSFTTGERVTFSGSTSIDTYTEILFRFDPLQAGGDTLSFKSAVTNGDFSINTLFAHDKAGDYEMSIFAGEKGQSLPFVGRIPVATVAQGTGTIDLPTGYFSGIQLDSAIPTEVAAGDAVRFSGTVSDPSITSISFEFVETTTGAEIDNFFDVASGSFSGTVVFSGDQSGTYKLECYAGLSGESLPSVGRYVGFTVTESTGAFSLPTDFFDGFVMSEGLPTEITTGDAINLTGTTSDSGVEVILFRFTSESGNEITHQVNVSGGSFRKGTVFYPDQTGTYTLDVFAGLSGQSLPHRGDFSPIVVTAGTGTVSLPVDAFSGLVLDEPFQTDIYLGQTPRLTGSLNDASLTQIAVRLDAPDGSTSDSEFATVTGGRFDVELPVPSVGTYDIVVFAGIAGQSLPFLDSVGPISVLAAQPRLSLELTEITFAQIETGQSSLRALKFTNIGSTDLTFTNSLVTDPFTILDIPSSTAPGATAQISVAFSPTTAGDFVGSLDFTTNDPDMPSVSLTLTGTAIAPAVPSVTLSASTFEWPTSLVGSSTTRGIVVQNTGGADLEILSMQTEGEPFNLLTSPTVIGAGDSLTVEVEFTPTAPGTFPGSLTILTNADPASYAITFTAEASESIALAGDIDGSGGVDFVDFLSFAGAFGTNVGDDGYISLADLDSSGTIDFVDFLTFASQFGKTL